MYNVEELPNATAAMIAGSRRVITLCAVGRGTRHPATTTRSACVFGVDARLVDGVGVCPVHPPSLFLDFSHSWAEESEPSAGRAQEACKYVGNCKPAFARDTRNTGNSAISARNSVGGGGCGVRYKGCPLPGPVTSRRQFLRTSTESRVDRQQDTALCCSIASQ